MKKRKLQIWLPMVVLLSALACASVAVSPSVTSGPAVDGQRPVKPSQESGWEKTLAAARQEGKLVLYSIDGPETRDDFAKAMREKYGVEIDFIVGRGLELAQKLMAERRAGLYYGDIYMGGLTTAISVVTPEGGLDPIGPELLLPEVLDATKWYGNKLHFSGDQRILSLRGDPRRPIAINTDFVKPEEMVSYKDLLNPKFKGKIIMGDPTAPGGTQATVFMVAEYVMNWDFLRELAKQDPYAIRNDQLVVEWLARGKYPVAFGAWSSIVANFQNAGAPIVELIPKEGSLIELGTRIVTVVNKRPHPNAARVFVNWLLTKEGQIVFAKGTGYQSLREDVPADMDQRLARKPGYKVVGEEFDEGKLKALPTMRAIFGPLLK